MKAKVISNYSLCTLAILNICTMTCVCCMQYTGKIYTDFFWWNLYMYIQIHRYIQTSFDNIRTHNKNMYCISLVHVEDRMPIYELLKPEDMKAVRLLLRTFQLQLAWSSPVRKPWKHCAALGFWWVPGKGCDLHDDSHSKYSAWLVYTMFSCSRSGLCCLRAGVFMGFCLTHSINQHQRQKGLEKSIGRTSSKSVEIDHDTSFKWTLSGCVIAWGLKPCANSSSFSKSNWR